jgi:hypothetical protein
VPHPRTASRPVHQSIHKQIPCCACQFCYKGNSDLTKPLTEKCSDLDLSLLKTNLPAHARRHCSSSRIVGRACQHTGDSVSVVRHTCPSVQLTCTTSSSCNKHPDGLGKGDGHDGWSVQAFCVASRSRRSRKAHFHSVQALLKQVCVCVCVCKTPALTIRHVRHPSQAHQGVCYRTALVVQIVAGIHNLVWSLVHVTDTHLTLFLGCSFVSRVQGGGTWFS